MFLHRVAGFTLSDNVKSSTEESRSEAAAAPLNCEEPDELVWTLYKNIRHVPMETPL